MSSIGMGGWERRRIGDVGRRGGWRGKRGVRREGEERGMEGEGVSRMSTG